MKVRWDRPPRAEWSWAVRVLGINWIDTAPIYGLGHSEVVVGRALDGLEPRPYVFTKASLQDSGEGHVIHNLERASIMREVEASLERLRLDAIDLYRAVGSGASSAPTPMGV